MVMITSVEEGKVLFHFSGLCMLINMEQHKVPLCGSLVWVYTRKFKRKPNYKIKLHPCRLQGVYLL